MSIIRNPRLNKGFENPNLVCSSCMKTNTYLYEVLPFRLCKGCLTHMIKEIDEAIIEDIKNND